MPFSRSTRGTYMGRFGRRTRSQNMQLQIAAATWRIWTRSSVDLQQQFHLSQNYFFVYPRKRWQYCFQYRRWVFSLPTRWLVNHCTYLIKFCMNVYYKFIKYQGHRSNVKVTWVVSVFCVFFQRYCVGFCVFFLSAWYRGQYIALSKLDIFNYLR